MPDTRWSLVLRSQALEGPGALNALGELMKLYWEPLYGYARSKGQSPKDAEDAVQGFYEVLITRSSITTVDQAKGKLRSFLLASFECYLIDLWQKRTAQKRGGTQGTLSLDQQLAENRYAAEPAHHLTPERLYERRWALTIVDRAMEAVEADYRRRGKEETYLALRSALEWNSADFAYADIGERLGMNENAVKQSVFRMRKKFRELLRWIVAETVANPAEVEAELAHLVSALGDA
jgi:RNA polymerase sigma factor (sigma-70 family)